jgi:hypothetical protein
MISGDPTFTGIGTVTGIDYMDRFFQYKTILGMNRQTSEVISLLDTLNEELFGAIPASSSTERVIAPRPRTEDATLSRLLQSFQRGVVDEDDFMSDAHTMLVLL